MVVRRMGEIHTLLCGNVIFFGLALWVATVSAQEWARFRGPNGAGVSQTVVPTRWSDKDYQWQVELPGKGHSSPVLWGDLLVVTCGAEETGTRRILGLDANSGEQLWLYEIAAPPHAKHQLNSLASATPAIDELHAYTCWRAPESFLVVAIDHAGKEAWRADLGPFRSGHGDGVSPIVHGELVIVAKEHEGDSEIVALDRRTGDARWRVPRRSKSTWATPCVRLGMDGQPELIFVSYEHGITAVEPATGQTLWESDVFRKEHVESTIGSPIIAGDLVLGGSGYLSVHQEVIAVRPTMGSDRRRVEQVYVLDRGAPLCTTPLAVGDLLFLWSDEGIVTCADVRTGQQHWQKRIGGTYYASPICAGEHVYNISADGDVVVLAAADKYQLVARNSLGEPSHSTSAVANGMLYLRTFSRVFALASVTQNNP